MAINDDGQLFFRAAGVFIICTIRERQWSDRCAGRSTANRGGMAYMHTMVSYIRCGIVMEMEIVPRSCLSCSVRPFVRIYILPFLPPSQSTEGLPEAFPSPLRIRFT